MELFDKVDPRSLDRRDEQLSMLSLGIIVVLEVGLALLMYPAVFSSNAGATGHTMRTLFFGFCALCVLAVAYLINRQHVVQHLRRNLLEQKTEIMQLRQEASTDLLETLPGFGHFQDQLTMGFRRAAQAGEQLSLILVRLKHSPMFDGPTEVSVALGDAARVLVRKLPADGSLYHLSGSAFAMLLPGTNGEKMNQLAGRVGEGLADASGAINRFSFETQVVNYPEQASTAYEIEQIAHAFSLANRPAPAARMK
jgi:GGDEF domain-containing protein